MAWQRLIIASLTLAWSTTCLAGAEPVGEGIPGLRGTAPEPADTGSPLTEESFPQATTVGEGQDWLLALSASKSSNFTAQFKRLDRDGDGFVSPAELRTPVQARLRSAGLQMTQPTLADKFFKVIDSNGDGKVDFAEYVAYMKRSVRQQDVNKLFKSVDLNGNGFVSKTELISMYRKIDIEVKDAAKFGALFRQFDTNNDGQLSLAEFVASAWLLKGTW